VIVEYDLSDSALLSPKAKALLTKDESAFAEQVAMAAELLNVDTTVFTGSALATVLRALAIQVSWQVDLDRKALYVKAESSSASHQSVTYRDGLGLIAPEALQMIGRVLAKVGVSQWGNIKSVR